MRPVPVSDGETAYGLCATYKGAHIPGCYACALGGHSRCTCDPLGAVDPLAAHEGAHPSGWGT